MSLSYDRRRGIAASNSLNIPGADLPAMELDDLRYFVAAYEAAGLHESASAGSPLRLDASLRVRRLESVLGSRLFEERNGRTQPTRSGEELYAHARQVLATTTGNTTIPAH